MDNRQLLIAGVIAPLVLLAAVLSYYLLVAVPDREARERDERAIVVVPAEAPPGRIDEGSGFEPSVVEPAPPPRAAEPEPGLEQPPQRETGVEAPPIARDALAGFADLYLSEQESAGASEVVRLYGERVRYFAMGLADKSDVYQDKLAYFRRFPDRRYALASPVRVVGDAEAGGATIRFEYTFSVGGGPGGERSGRAWTEMDLVPDGGSFLITGERGDVY